MASLFSPSPLLLLFKGLLSAFVAEQVSPSSPPPDASLGSVALLEEGYGLKFSTLSLSLPPCSTDGFLSALVDWGGREEASVSTLTFLGQNNF